MTTYYIKKTENKTIIAATTNGNDGMPPFLGAIEAPRKPGKPRFIRSRVRTIPKNAETFTPSAFQLRALRKAEVI